MSDSLFPLNDEHRMIRDTARDFAKSAIAPIAAQFDESGEFPFETIKKMGEMGFMGIEIPEQYGGAGLDTLSYVRRHGRNLAKWTPPMASSCRSIIRFFATPS